MAEENQEGQKTVVSFVVGLLIGGLLVWAFSGPAEEQKGESKTKDAESELTTEEATTEDAATSNEAKTEAATTGDAASTPEKPSLTVGEGKITLGDQVSGSAIALAAATYPVSEGWVGVRDYQNDQLGALLGVVRFSEEQGLVPNQIVLQRPTTAGREYAVVIYKENGDRQFNIAEDAQIDTIFATFTAK